MILQIYQIIIRNFRHFDKFIFNLAEIYFMKIKNLVVFLLLVVFFININASSYWGPTGHRVIGEIAEKHINNKTKKEIQKLLKNKSLAFVSTFGDEIKSDNRYRKFSSWHYVNMELDENYQDSGKNPKGDLVTGIAYCKKIIKDEGASDEDRAFYLKLLIHFMGNLHQPMHIGLKSDKGGNDFKLKWFNKRTNLHRVWDSDMIDGFKMGYLELAENADYLTSNQIEGIQQGTVVDWVNEAHELTKEVYSSVEIGDNLWYQYSYKYMNTARSQMQIAGIRLAKVLNELF